MNILLEPFIIDRVFDFLSVVELDKCRYVCRLWEDFAIKKLKKCPPIDGCRIILKREFFGANDDSAGTEDAQRQVEELKAENWRMNGVALLKDTGCNFPDHGFLYYWYIVKGSTSCLLPKFKVDDIVQGFLSDEAQCFSALSFITCPKEFRHILKHIPSSFPAVVLRRIRMVCDPGSLDSMINIDSGSEMTLDLMKDKYPALIGVDATANTYFEGFHINQFIEGVKITITDWSDPNSERPNVADLEFPVKSVLHLTTVYTYELSYVDEETKNIMEFFADTESIFTRGFIDRGFGEGLPKILSVNLRRGKIRMSPSVTITFAGRNVKAAIFEIHYSFDLEEKLNSFKRNLDFEVHHSRTIGFLLDTAFSKNDPVSDATHMVSKVFPNITMIDIGISHSFHPSDLPQAIFSLIHFDSSKLSQ